MLGRNRVDKKQSREAWLVPFGVPAALATWILVALELAGIVLRYPTTH